MNALPPGLHQDVRNWITMLRSFRSSLNMSLVQLESELGTSTSALSRYFNGTRIPEIEFLDRLSDAVQRRTRSPVLPEVAHSMRQLYFAACRAHDPVRAEVYELKDRLRAAQEEARSAQGTVLTLRAQVRAEQRQRRFVLAAPSVDALDVDGPDSARPPERSDLAAAVSEIERVGADRDTLGALLEQRIRDLLTALRDVRDIEDARENVEARLREAELRLNAALEKEWRESERSAHPGARWWRWGQGTAAWAATRRLTRTASATSRSRCRRWNPPRRSPLSRGAPTRSSSTNWPCSPRRRVRTPRPPAR